MNFDSRSHEQYISHNNNNNKTIRDRRPTLCRTFDVVTRCFNRNILLTLWHTLMTYYVISLNGEESFNKFLSPDQDFDLDHPRGGLIYEYTSSGVKKLTQPEQYFLS